MTIRKPSSTMLAISCNSSVATTTVGPPGSIRWNYEDGTLHVYDGVTVGGRTTPLVFEAPAPSYTFQGTNYGYTSGGAIPTTVNTIDKFPFASDTNATDVGNLTAITREAAGQSSETSAYTSGGTWIHPAPTVARDKIQKFPFASDTNATDIGTLIQGKETPSGQSSSTHGYTAGGNAPSQPGLTNVIDKFPFSSDSNSTDVGDLTQARNRPGGQSSTTHGYASGGVTPSVTDTIDKFSFSNDGNATDVGELTQAREKGAGQSSETSGYTSGGAAGPGVLTIDKFPFSSDTSATLVGDLTQNRNGKAGQSSTVAGYSSGGEAAINIIDKVPFSSDTNATDVGDLTQGRRAGAGQQV